MLRYTFLIVALITVSCHGDPRVVDLTHAHSPESIYWPGNPEYNLTTLSRGQKAYYWYESNYFGTPEHGGTHIDAPSHFVKGQWRGQQIPIERLMGPGVVIDVKAKVESNLDYRVTVDDLLDWESTFGNIPTGAIVMMNSGWDVRYPNKSLTFGTDTPSDPSTFHFPAFHEDAVNWLVTNRVVHVIGVDTPSTDYGQSTTFPVHVIIGKDDIIGAENVASLDKIPESGPMIYVAAMKVFDSSGGPARIFATFDDETSTSSADGRHCSILLMGTVALFYYVLHGI